MITCNTIQLLIPDPPRNLTIGDDNNSLAVEEGGKLALVNGQSEYTVLFTQEKLSADYDFTESDVTSTDVDDDLLISPTMMERTTAGFTLSLDGAPDSSHYVFNYRVRVTSI